MSQAPAAWRIHYPFVSIAAGNQAALLQLCTDINTDFMQDSISSLYDVPEMAYNLCDSLVRVKPTHAPEPLRAVVRTNATRP